MTRSRFVVLVVAISAIAYLAGSVLGWPGLKVPAEAEVAAAAWIVAAVVGGLAWTVGLVAGAIGGGLAAGAGAAASGSSVAMVVVGFIGFVGLGAGTIYVLGPVVAAAEEHPFESIAPVLGVISGFGTDSLAKAADLPSPFAEVLATTNGLLVICAGFLRRGGFKAKLVGGTCLIIVPVMIVGNLVVRRSAAELWTAILSMDGTVWLGLALVVITAGLTALVALETRGD